MTQAERPPSFVGVCGVQSVSDLRGLEQRARRILPTSGYFLMAGTKQASVLSNFSGQLHGVRPFVHCDFSTEMSFETIVFRNLELTARCVRGLQLNVLPWMEVDFAPLIREIKRRYPQVMVTLQAHRRTMQGSTPDQVASRLRDLPIDYIFFDPSQSRGRGYDVAEMTSYVEAVWQRLPKLGVAVAGGLGGQTMDALFRPLAKTYQGTSCDAFGKLHNPSTGSLSWPSVDSYLRAWSECVRSDQNPTVH